MPQLYGASAGNHNFTAKWDGATLLSLVNTPAQDFTHYSYLVTATGTTTTLSFTALAEQAAWYLDDVSVTQSTETAAGTITFTDQDSTDTHIVSATPNGSGYVGAFRPVLATDSTGDGASAADKSKKRPQRAATSAKPAPARAQ